MKKGFMFLVVVTVLSLTLTGCHDIQEGLVSGSYEIEKTDLIPNTKYLDGETLYVPIYSSVFHHQSALNYKLTATLSIHNIDLDNSIKLTKADYYNTNGDLVQAYLEDVLILKPLQVIQIVIQEEDERGGTGANFLVEWVSETDVNSPIVEAVMISARGQQGISFISPGRVIKYLE
ncbi:hypothetical protein X793_03900 [Dehalococcoides mccartyi CG4]|uniref:DUF3124 domain-containing protein n=1 Tax=Dehalococcoides mccartyi TaxID=61435 RepID=UPI0004E03227|nr:DUF3124 domain-containing protein [Dehalococcoides mccartyi]AII59485.1 hypothetical protein X793_03900 [Dehalococcoides mccartyi CG4]